MKQLIPQFQTCWPRDPKKSEDCAKWSSLHFRDPLNYSQSLILPLRLRLSFTELVKCLEKALLVELILLCTKLRNTWWLLNLWTSSFWFKKIIMLSEIRKIWWTMKRKNYFKSSWFSKKLQQDTEISSGYLIPLKPLDI